MSTLREDLQDPQDFDVALFLLAARLGIIENTQEAWFLHKAEFCSRTPLNDTLSEIMSLLIDEGVMLWDGSRFQWDAGRVMLRGASS